MNQRFHTKWKKQLFIGAKKKKNEIASKPEGMKECSGSFYALVSRNVCIHLVKGNYWPHPLIAIVDWLISAVIEVNNFMGPISAGISTNQGCDILVGAQFFPGILDANLCKNKQTN